MGVCLLIVFFQVCDALLASLHFFPLAFSLILLFHGPVAAVTVPGFDERRPLWEEVVKLA